MPTFITIEVTTPLGNRLSIDATDHQQAKEWLYTVVNGAAKNGPDFAVAGGFKITRFVEWTTPT